MSSVQDAGSGKRFEPPAIEQLARSAARQGMDIDVSEIEQELPRVMQLLRVFERLYELPESNVPLRYPHRNLGRAPTPAEDPCHAIKRFCDVRGATTGPLAGMRIGVKDNISIAGMPMNGDEEDGSGTLPDEDAVVVERLLAAGATIAAKTTIGGDTRNPRDHRFSSGGSSSGSAAAVAAGIVDGALGVDQGGSIRVPAAWCGIVGMKPTHGLVPTYGLTYWDHTLDHIGPMTRTVADNAAMLEAIAGNDWRDPQWVRAQPVAGDYTGSLTSGVAGLGVGVVAESLDATVCVPDTVSAVQEAQEKFALLGAKVTRASVPLWLDSYTIWRAALTLGVTAIVESFGHGYGHLGRVGPSRLMPCSSARVAERSSSLPDEIRAMLLTSQHLREVCRGSHYARVQNLRLQVRRQVDLLFDDVDLLITPTWPTGPTKLGQPGRGEARAMDEQDDRMMNWTCLFNLTGHPALTLPSGLGADGMPRGLQIVGRRFEEGTVFRAASAIEATLC